MFERAANPHPVEDREGVHTLADFRRRVQEIAHLLQARRHGVHPVALLMDNGAAWLAADLACQQLEIPLVPLPAFFTPDQKRHAVMSAGVGALITDCQYAARDLGFTATGPQGAGVMIFDAPQPPAHAMPQAGCKLTFTSGTTGTPKGIRLSGQAQWRLAQSLHTCLGQVGLHRHLSLLPLPILLENVAGAYHALVGGARLILPPVHTVGLAGAAGFDAARCIEAIAEHQPASVILLPHMLRELLSATRAHDPRLASLKFIAVGGARTPPQLIEAAQARGLPVYEGYGLTECGSVVTLNLPGASRVGSVGRPLPGRAVRVSPAGRLEVESESGWIDTGDAGRIDEDGFVRVEGRADHVIVTAFGRNINPEWPESLLTAAPSIAQALVLGAGHPFLGALIVPSPGADEASVRAAIDNANAALPDYARIRTHALAPAPFTPQQGLLTANGRLRREAIMIHYSALITRLFQEKDSAHAVFR